MRRLLSTVGLEVYARRQNSQRLGLFISQDCDCLDLGVLAYRLLVLYEWFADMCVKLSGILENGLEQLCLDMEGVAA